MIPDLQKETLVRLGVHSVHALYNSSEPTKFMFLDEFDSVAASRLTLDGMKSGETSVG